MGSYKITPEEAAIDAYDVSVKCLNFVANSYKKIVNIDTLSTGYQALMKGADILADKADNAVGRLSGASYHINSLKAMLECVKGVEVGVLKEIKNDPEKSFKDKIRDMARHVSDKFTHESTVAASVYFGKGAIIQPIAIGVATTVALISPASYAVAGFVAATGIKMAATYFLSTHQGHHLECSVAEKIKQGCRFLRGVHRASSGADPECGEVAEVAEQMEKHATQKHAHVHHHGDHHHKHHHAGHTLKQDVKAIGSAFTKPKAFIADMTFNFKQELANAKQLFGKKETVSISPVKSKFSTPVIASPMIEEKSRPAAKAQTMKL